MRLLGGLFILLICGLTLSCRPKPPTPAPKRASVCATAYPLADIVRQIGADHVRLDWILDLGDPVSGYIMGPRDRDRLTGVDLLVASGTRTETFASSVIFSLEQTGRVFELESTETARSAPVGGLLWLDPIVVRDALPGLTEKLIRILPRNIESLRAGAADFSARIDQLVAKYPNRDFGRGKVIVLDLIFAPLLDRFGVGSVLIEAQTLKLTESDIRQIRDAARDNGIKAIVVRFDTPPGTLADIEARTGLRVFTLDHFGFPHFQGHATYLEQLQFNLDQLLAATRL